MHRRSLFHDPNAAAGREIMEHTGLTSGLATVGGAFGPAASIVLGQAGTARKPSKAILLATLGR
jgi:ornithine carbamoyltransferase